LGNEVEPSREEDDKFL